MIVSEKDNKLIELVSYKSVQEDSDLMNQYYSWLEDVQTVRLVGSESLIMPKGREFIDESLKRFTGENVIGFFIRYVPENLFVGTTKLDRISLYHRSAWDGILIGEKKFRGHGIGFHVYRLLLAYAFQVLGLHKINGGCNENNVPMIQTFKKIGYTLEGQLRKNDYIEGQYSDHLYFGILRDEFLRNHKVELFQ